MQYLPYIIAIYALFGLASSIGVMIADTGIKVARSHVWLLAIGAFLLWPLMPVLLISWWVTSNVFKELVPLDNRTAEHLKSVLEPHNPLGKLSPNYRKTLVKSWLRDFGTTCPVCRVEMVPIPPRQPKPKPNNATVDHILALTLGGLSEKKNLRVICHGCNFRKSVGEAKLREKKARQQSDGPQT